MLLNKSYQPGGHSEAVLDNWLVSAGDIKAQCAIDINLLIFELFSSTYYCLSYTTYSAGLTPPVCIPHTHKEIQDLQASILLTTSQKRP